MAKRGRPKKTDTVKRLSAREVLVQLEKHEARCAVELKEINRRLDSGSDKFKFQQNTIWGLYALVIATGVLSELV